MSLAQLKGQCVKHGVDIPEKAVKGRHAGKLYREGQGEPGQLLPRPDPPGNVCRVGPECEGPCQPGSRAQCQGAHQATVPYSYPAVLKPSSKMFGPLGFKGLGV